MSSLLMKFTMFELFFQGENRKGRSHVRRADWVRVVLEPESLWLLFHSYI